MEPSTPPSSSMILPVIHADAGDAKNNAEFATSSTSPNRPSGVFFIIPAFISGFGLRKRSSASVSIAPGSIALTRTLGAKSWASKRVS